MPLLNTCKNAAKAAVGVLGGWFVCNRSATASLGRSGLCDELLVAIRCINAAPGLNTTGLNTTGLSTTGDRTDGVQDHRRLSISVWRPSRVAFVLLLILSNTGFGQSGSFPNSQPIPRATSFGGENAAFGPNMVPLGPSTISRTPPDGSRLTLPNGNTLATPQFDPFGARNGSANTPLLPDSIQQGRLQPSTTNGFNTGPPQPLPAFGNNPPLLPATGYPNTNLPNPGIPGSPQFNPNANFPNSVYPNQTPPTLFPNGLGFNGQPGNWTNPGAGNNSLTQPMDFTSAQNWFGNLWSGPSVQNGTLGNGWFEGGPSGPIWNGQTQLPVYRFFQGPRFRQTYVYGDSDPTALEVNDTDTSLVFAIPNFLGSLQPLYIVPSFSIHSWAGPKDIAADLPGSAYSAFLDFGWQTDPLRTFGVDLGVRVGAFTDFNTFNSDSVRILGKGLGRVRLTPNTTLRAGVYYIDRNRYKLVPAGGILWTPNPDTRFDIFFPEPKLAHYLTTVGTQDVWWYITGYYGGGSWTITRADDTEDSVDMNEIRLMLGAEWGRNEAIRQGQRLVFAEIGYVFNRELLYDANPGDNTEIEDSFSVRVGIGY